MRPGGRLIVIEGILAPEGHYTRQIPVSVELQDLLMMVMLNGKERTERQFRGLLEKAGFRLQGVTYTRGIFHILQAEPAPDNHD